MAFTIELTRVGTGGKRRGGRADLRLSSCAPSKHGRNPSLGLRLAGLAVPTGREVVNQGGNREREWQVKPGGALPAGGFM